MTGKAQGTPAEFPNSSGVSELYRNTLFQGVIDCIIKPGWEVYFSGIPMMAYLAFSTASLPPKRNAILT